MRYVKHCCAVVLALLVAQAGGCGGDGGGGGGFVPADQLLGGLWSGSLSIDGAPGTQELVGISTDDGRFRLISVDAGGQFIGTAEASGVSVSGSGKAYAPPGTTWRDGSTVTTVTFTGTVSQRKTLTGSWSTGTGESGSVSLEYDVEYEKDSSLSLLAGVWMVYDGNVNPIATFTIEANGRFSGSNVLGCNSTGQISIIDARYNVYDIESSVAGCAIAGDYEGLGTLGMVDAPNDAFVFSVSNDARALLLLLEK